MLREALITGTFEHGSKIKVDPLRKLLGCSASTIRELLFRLSTENLVEFQEQRGFRMPPRSPEVQHQLTQFRIMLECEGTVLSIRLGGVSWEARLSAAHHKLSHIETRVRDSNDPTPLIPIWTAAEQEFHETLIEACNNAYLKSTHLRIYRQFRQQLITADRTFRFVPENIAQHQAILNAALDRNEDAVKAAITDHLSRNLTAPLI